MRGPRWSVAGLLAAGALVAVGPLPGEPAGASCAGPELKVPGSHGERPALALGAEVRIEGDYFFDGCDDSGGGRSDGPGCQADEQRTTQKPLDDVTLVLRQGEESWDLGTVDADDDYTVAWTVVLPDGVRPGRATLSAALTRKLVVTIRQ